MSCISQASPELDFFKFSSRDTVFFSGALLPEEASTAKQEVCYPKLHSLHIPRAVTELSGTGKGTGSC